MNPVTRRKFMTGGLVAAGGVAGLAVADRLAKRYGLLPPDSGELYGAGATLTYAAQRLLTTHSLAREFAKSQISEKPFANAVAPGNVEFKQHEAAGFADWKLTVEGMVARPTVFSMSDLKAMPVKSQVTEIACEEGWSYVAEWMGTPLAGVLNEVGVLPEARYMVYWSMDKNWWDSVDMGDALHPQTLLAMGMNDGALPVPFGGPLRLRVSRQLGYKSVKYITRLTFTDTMRGVGGPPGKMPEYSYSWFAGI